MTLILFLFFSAFSASLREIQLFTVNPLMAASSHSNKDSFKQVRHCLLDQMQTYTLNIILYLFYGQVPETTTLNQLFPARGHVTGRATRYSHDNWCRLNHKNQTKHGSRSLYTKPGFIRNDALIETPKFQRRQFWLHINHLPDFATYHTYSLNTIPLAPQDIHRYLNPLINRPQKTSSTQPPEYFGHRQART